MTNSKFEFNATIIESRIKQCLNASLINNFSDDNEKRLLTEQAIQELLIIEDNNAFITAAYHTILGRKPDPAGAANHMKQLLMGYSRKLMLYDMLMSAEFIAQELNFKTPGFLMAAIQNGQQKFKFRKLIKKIPLISPIITWFYHLLKLPTNLNRMNVRLNEINSYLESISNKIDSNSERIINVAHYHGNKQMTQLEKFRQSFAVTTHPVIAKRSASFDEAIQSDMDAKSSL